MVLQYHRWLLWLYQINTVFSTFITKEISTANNIKNRINRQLVLRLLKVIQEFMLNNKIDKNGIILYAGTNEYDIEIFKAFTPKITLNQFYYNCGKKFVVDRFIELFDDIKGYIIFANGDNCNIYKFESTFVKIKSINGNLIKRQRKGGQSALRFSRLAEESRHEYVIHVIDYINSLCTENCWMFGSNEIVKMILERKELLVKLNYGGFLDFNNDTINDTKKWLSYLNKEEVDETKIKEIVLFLDTNVDMLDFDENNKLEMKYYFDYDEIHKHKNSAYYERIKLFNFIGVKYYDYVDYYN